MAENIDEAAYTKVVVMLIDGNSGRLVNVVCAKPSDLTAIGGVQSAQPQRVQYYDLQGRLLASPSGICIQRTIYADGSVQSKKFVK